MIVKGVLDRIVDGITAVILVGDNEEEYFLSVDRLPTDIEEGSWLEIHLEDEGIVALRPLSEETDLARKRVVDKMSRLRSRGSSIRKKE